MFVICFISQWVKRSEHGLFVFRPKKTNNMEEALFDWPILLQYDVKTYRLISRKFTGMIFFFCLFVCFIFVLLCFVVVYMEDITWPRGDMKFLFECWKIFHEWPQRTSEIFFSTREEKFRISKWPCNVLFIIWWWNTKPFYWNSFLVWKVKFIMKP